MTSTSKLLTRSILLALTTGLALSACKPSTPESETVAPAGTEAAPTTSTAPAADAAVPASAEPIPTTLTPVSDAARAIRVERTGMCSFDKIDGVKVEPNAVARFQTPASARIEGWVADMTSMSHPDDARLRLEASDGRAWEIGFGVPVSRPDVAKYYKTKALTDSGFALSADLSSLPAGVYRVSAVHAGNGHTLACVGPQVQIGD